MRPFLSGFRIMEPAHRISQKTSLEQLAKAHVASGRRVEAELERFACGPAHIAWRGHEAPPEKLFSAEPFPRSECYARAVDRAFARFYADEGRSNPGAPSNLIHVSCTGYASPSGAQRLVSRLGWQRRTQVTHAYHMGCYAAIPALRIASGFLARGDATTDIVHTELCSLHLDPREHSPEQLVVQSLFADGFIRYRVQGVAGGEPGLELFAVREELIPGTEPLMTWIAEGSGDFGFRMTLSRKVPGAIRGALLPFLDRLLAGAALDRDVLGNDSSVFAIHPGGPRILDAIRDLLGIRESRLEASRRVLRERGNMSSATLPHIWREMVLDAQAGRVAPGSWIVSLAFGPGLTLCGAVFRSPGCSSSG